MKVSVRIEVEGRYSATLASVEFSREIVGVPPDPEKFDVEALSRTQLDMLAAIETAKSEIGLQFDKLDEEMRDREKAEADERALADAAFGRVAAGSDIPDALR